MLSVKERSRPKGSLVSVETRDAAQDAAERTVVVSVLIIIFVERFGRRSCCALFTAFRLDFKITKSQVERESRRVRMGKAAAQSRG